MVRTLRTHYPEPTEEARARVPGLQETPVSRNEPGPGAFMHEQRMFEFPTRLGAR